MKTQVENGLSKLFNFQVKTINMSDQAVFTLKDSGFHAVHAISRGGGDCARKVGVL